MKALDLTRKRFERLLVLRRAENSKWGHRRWHCECDCGNKLIVYASDLKSGNTRSCGCLQTESRITHGWHGTPTYKTWTGMIGRCTNLNDKSYTNYGGRGITVCKQWLKFENFLNDMGERPGGLTIERIDNDKGYLPRNCKWASHTEQNRNQRISKNNTSGIMGVFWDKSREKWYARIGIDYKGYHLGYFDTIEEATTARKNAEQKYWNKHAS